ncbi:hypothetical protein EV138_5981 [Kribbella voronezhensis]|uniref:Uncharacterized protein n=1 Tax=Kribbella voronezhensis TaxID=2512212 RepID=A0A4R7SYD6_9ACTN|nr:hypothetical protein EV138_5981 [Kribbella voronezhensis]
MEPGVVVGELLGDWVPPGVLVAVPDGLCEGALSGEDEHALSTNASATTPPAAANTSRFLASGVLSNGFVVNES